MPRRSSATGSPGSPPGSSRNWCARAATSASKSSWPPRRPPATPSPTKIRDNCQVAISFAQRTSEAAIAILGTDITHYTDAHPRRLQNPDYVGVATLVADGRPGYTLIRTPKAAPDQDIQRLARQTAHHTADPLTLLGGTESGENSTLIIRDRKAA